MTLQIERSGYYSDDLGQMFLVSQGLSGYRLVSGKQILFRLFLNPSVINQLNLVVAMIRPSSRTLRLPYVITIPTGSLILENSTPNGPSVGILFKGKVFPYALNYSVRFILLSVNGPMLVYDIPNLSFSLSGRVRILVHFLQGSAPSRNFLPNESWYADMTSSLYRFASMLPVQDGVSNRLDDPNAGLCYWFGKILEAWPDEVGISQGDPRRDPLFETNQINSIGGPAHVDVTVLWRPIQISLNEPPGGIAPYDYLPGPANFVGGDWFTIQSTAPIMAQEVGHLFGLEPPGSPHYEDPSNPKHSKDPMIIDPFAFDFYLLRPYIPLTGSRFIGDPMNNYGGGWAQGRDSVLYNAYDWDHLHQKLVPLRAVSLPIRLGTKPSIKDWKNLLSNVPKIRVEKSVSIMTPKSGFEWNWTYQGFQLLKKERAIPRSKSISSVKNLLSLMTELDISEFFAPVGGREFDLVINPNLHKSVHTHEFEAVPHDNENKTSIRTTLKKHTH